VVGKVTYTLKTVAQHELYILHITLMRTTDWEYYTHNGGIERLGCSPEALARADHTELLDDAFDMVLRCTMLPGPDGGVPWLPCAGSCGKNFRRRSASA
jgi:hypothetical protein